MYTITQAEKWNSLATELNLSGMRAVTTRMIIERFRWNSLLVVKKRARNARYKELFIFICAFFKLTLRNKMKKFTTVVKFLAVGFVLSTILLLSSSSSRSTLGFPVGDDNPNEIIPSINGSSLILNTCITTIPYGSYYNGLPYSVIKRETDPCGDTYESLYPVSYIVNTFIFGSTSWVLYIVAKELKARRAKDDK